MTNLNKLEFCRSQRKELHSNVACRKHCCTISQLYQHLQHFEVASMHLVWNNCLHNQHNLFQSYCCMRFHCWADLYRLILIQGSPHRIFIANSGWTNGPRIPVLTRNIQNWTILDQKVDLRRQKKPIMNSKFSFLSKIISIFKCTSRLTLSCCILIGLCHLCQPMTKENDPLTTKKVEK